MSGATVMEADLEEEEEEEKEEADLTVRSNTTYPDSSAAPFCFTLVLRFEGRLQVRLEVRFEAQRVGLLK
jgi:hypothetical protein